MIASIRLIFVAGLAVSIISACTFGVPIDRGQIDGLNAIPAVKKSKSGNPSSYVVFGKRYYVLDSAHGFVERGTASWYGTKFHGRRTSSGEVYNMHGMTAAHKTLPLPTYVRVENMENGKSVIVKVNDRGPFVGTRIIDLSYAAAQKLGVVGPGTAEVEISAVRSASENSRPVVRSIPLTDQAAADIPLFIQMGSFGSEVNAQNMSSQLRALNEKAVSVSQLQTTDGLLYRVRVGPLYGIDEANAVLSRLNQKGFNDARIVVDE
ncbi:MAG: septal ring lytic transglycosylase RlpA family protein [Gammaproteobacteria bacterium]|nr:septal ring lytic transglycosylase RlpA family protein [Gammaproteobacteria bacterium]